MSTRAALPPIPAFPEPWPGAWRFAAAMTWGGLATLTQLWDPRPLRSFWSKTLSQAMDRVLRSPEFLELVAGNLRAAAALARVTPQPRP